MGPAAHAPIAWTHLMRIDDLKLRTKALAPLAMMALAVAAIIGFGAYKLASISGQANDLISRRDKAAVYVARATRSIMMGPYSAFGALVYDGSSWEGRTAQADFFTQLDKLDTLLGSASELAPDYAASFKGIASKFHEVAEAAKKPLAIGEDSPGLAAGKDLKPEDLDKLAEGAKEITDVDTSARNLANQLLTIDDTMVNENARAAVDLTTQSRVALIWLVGVGLLSALAAGVMTFWISTFKVARPLSELSRQMQALANGDLGVDIHEANNLRGSLRTGGSVYEEKKKETENMKRKTGRMGT